jgi:hypothetical protein
MGWKEGGRNIMQSLVDDNRSIRVFCTSGFKILAARLYERAYSISLGIKWSLRTRSFGCNPPGVRGRGDTKWRLGLVGNWPNEPFTRLLITRQKKSKKKISFWICVEEWPIKLLGKLVLLRVVFSQKKGYQRQPSPPPKKKCQNLNKPKL